MASKPVDIRNVIILIALVILLAAGTAYAVYTYLGISFARTVGPSGSGEGHPLAPGPMVDVGTFTVNLAAGDAPSARYVRTGIVLEVDSEETKQWAEQRSPQVRDRVISVLRQQTMESIHGAEGMERLRQRLRDAINEVLVEGVVRDVYFVDLVVQ
ncbi:MAG TPA: flagellar basal body-associated protein FliL [Limnochordales bacterium]